jgi:ribose-phosphate pyrophosphokinase
MLFKIVSIKSHNILKERLVKSLENHGYIDCETDVSILNFTDGEVCINFNESLRGTHLFIIGETVHNLTETLLLIDAAKRNSVREITLILPYYGYSRQDKTEGKRASIGAKMLANIFESMGVNRVITIDPHFEQLQGYFQIPVEIITSRTLFATQIHNLIKANRLIKENLVFCAPDSGASKKVQKFARIFGSPMVLIDKVRDKAESIESMTLIGDVSNKDVIISDDIFASGGTILEANKLLKQKGAKSVTTFITHAVLTNPNILLQLDSMLYVSDTTLKSEPFENSMFITIGCHKVLAQAIEAISKEESLKRILEFND